MLRIFSKAGSSKDLCLKVKKTCGIKISKDDTRSNAEHSLKRCVQLSLSSHQPWKHLSKDMPPESSNVDQLSKRITSGRSAKQLSFSTPPATTAHNSTCTTTSAKDPKRTISNSAKELSLSTPKMLLS